MLVLNDKYRNESLSKYQICLHSWGYLILGWFKEMFFNFMIIGSCLTKGSFRIPCSLWWKGDNNIVTIWTNRGWIQSSFHILKGVVFLSLSPLKCKQEVDSMDEPTLWSEQQLRPAVSWTKVEAARTKTNNWHTFRGCEKRFNHLIFDQIFAICLFYCILQI